MSICILNVISLSLVALSETIGRLGAVFAVVAGVLASAISSLCFGVLSTSSESFCVWAISGAFVDGSSVGMIVLLAPVRRISCSLL